MMVAAGDYVRTPDGVGKATDLLPDTVGVALFYPIAVLGDPQDAPPREQDVVVTRFWRRDVTYLGRDPLVAKIEATLDRYEAAMDEPVYPPTEHHSNLLTELIADMRALAVAATPERTEAG